MLVEVQRWEVLKKNFYGGARKRRKHVILKILSTGSETCKLQQPFKHSCNQCSSDPRVDGAFHSVLQKGFSVSTEPLLKDVAVVKRWDYYK